VNGRRLAILGYHQVGGPPIGGPGASYYVPQRVLNTQLGQLREAGWQFVDADTLIAALAGEGTLPSLAALVTFDDGYRTLLDHALPVLSEYECPAVVFVPTDHIGGHDTFDYGSSHRPGEELCDWDDLRRLEQAGIAVQSHSASHRAFSDLGPDELRAELAGSKKKLERELEREVRLLAYPYGDAGLDADLTADLLEETGYSAACLYGGGPFDPWQADPFRLARIAVGPGTDIRAKLS